MQKQQEYLSYHDDLTGLLNRNSLVHYFDTVDEKKLKSIGALSVDINGLKNFNKEFGRDYGDRSRNSCRRSSGGVFSQWGSISADGR